MDKVKAVSRIQIVSSTVTVTVVEKPARKLIFLRHNTARFLIKKHLLIRRCFFHAHRYGGGLLLSKVSMWSHLQSA